VVPINGKCHMLCFEYHRFRVPSVSNATGFECQRLRVPEASSARGFECQRLRVDQCTWVLPRPLVWVDVWVCGVSDACKGWCHSDQPGVSVSYTSTAFFAAQSPHTHNLVSHGTCTARATVGEIPPPHTSCTERTSKRPCDDCPSTWLQMVCPSSWSRSRWLSHACVESIPDTGPRR
jgi:hypothetical protein